MIFVRTPAPRFAFTFWFFKHLMRKIFLHIFTVFALASMVAEDLYCFIDLQQAGIEVLSNEMEENETQKETKTEDDVQGKTFKIKAGDFFLSLTTIFTVCHAGIPESYSKLFHPSTTLAIFSPPPNVG